VIRRSAIRWWLGAAVVLAFVVGAFWLALRNADPARLERAMGSAARQRELVP